MYVVNERLYNLNPLEAERIELQSGTGAPSTAVQFTDAGVGSTYWRNVADGHVQQYVKVNDNGRADDWALERGIISQRVLYTDFTDGGAAAGTLALANQIPSGVSVEKTNVTGVTGFAGDTSAVIIVGVAAGDTDRYSTGTPSIFTTVDAAVMGVPSGIREHTTATTVTVTVTSASDFTAVNAGAFTISIFYRK
jgi:hypothetical protein